MKSVLDFFPTTICVENLKDEITSSEDLTREFNVILEKAFDFGYRRNNVRNFQSKTVKAFEEYNLPTLKNLFRRKVDEYAKDVLRYRYDESFFTQSWFCVNEPGNYFDIHNHTNSVISGVFFMRGEDDSGNLTFHKPYANISQIEPDIIFDSNNPRTFKTVIAPFVEYNLVLFPASLQHHVGHNESKKNRVSFAFNSFIDTLGYEDGITELKITQRQLINWHTDPPENIQRSYSG